MKYEDMKIEAVAEVPTANRNRPVSEKAACANRLIDEFLASGESIWSVNLPDDEFPNWGAIEGFLVHVKNGLKKRGLAAEVMVRLREFRIYLVRGGATGDNPHGRIDLLCETKLSNRVVTALSREGVESVEEAADMTLRQLVRIPNFGATAMAELCAELTRLNANGRFMDKTARGQ